MPNNIIKAFAKQSGKSKEEVEKLWKSTEAIVKKEYPNKKGESVYRLIVGILKKRLKIVDEDAVITMGSMGPSALYRTRALDTVSRFGDFKNMSDWGKTTSDVKPKKKRNESAEKAIEYINKLLDEQDDPQIQKLVKDYQVASKAATIQAAKQVAKAANSNLSGAVKKKKIIAAKILQQKAKQIQYNQNMTSDDVVDMETK